MQGSKFLVAMTSVSRQRSRRLPVCGPSTCPLTPTVRPQRGMWSPCSEPRVRSSSAEDHARCEGLSDQWRQAAVIVVSHGNGGSFINFRDTAETLAGAGFIVVAINHPGDNSGDAVGLPIYRSSSSGDRHQAPHRFHAPRLTRRTQDDPEVSAS